MKLQAKLDAFRAEFEAGKPPYNASRKIIERGHRATDELKASGQAERAKRVGDRAPDFELHDPQGNIVSSKRLLAKGPLVVSFYRGVWCPYCNMELRALQDFLPELAKFNASLVAISPQSAPNSRKSIRENELTFPILSDVKGKIGEAFGLKYKLPDYLIEVYASRKNDLPSVNEDPEWTLPMPARYLIDRDGTIVYAEVNPDYRCRPDPEDMLPALQKLSSAVI